MKTFRCICGTDSILFFESTRCEACGRLVGCCGESQQIVSFDQDSDPGIFVRTDDLAGTYRQCSNFSSYGVCNGMVAVESNSDLCFACSFNYQIPDLSVPDHIELWRRMETAKRRTLFTLAGLNLPIPRRQDGASGLHFSFITDKQAAGHFQQATGNEPVFTGHDNGEITINLAEADDVARHRTKESMNESYRTLLGHFRHEIGHFYWDKLIAPDAEKLGKFREVFGDDTYEYQLALDRHYQQGPPPNWQESYISSYATMHPWEDWAETWGHYMHMIDTLETAKHWGLVLQQSPASDTHLALDSLNLPQQDDIVSWQTPVEELISVWIRFSLAQNALNRSMGHEDAYPFVVSARVQQKIVFVHQVIHTHRAPVI